MRSGAPAGRKSFWGGTWWCLFSNPGKLIQNKPFQVNSFLEEARCSELLLFVSLGVITLYIKLTQDFSVTVWNSILFAFILVDTNIPSVYGCWIFHVKHQAVFQFYFNFKYWISVFIFALVSPEHKHTSKTAIIVLIQAQNFCGRRSCHYIEEASPQKKNDILIKIEMQICLLPKPTFLS